VVTAEEVSNQLRQLASTDSLPSSTAELVEKWTAAGAGPDVVEPILRFMEDHRELDFGVPGPLVHFVERFYRNGYEGELLASIKRKPTSHTVWMLNRLINGTVAVEVRRLLVDALEQARTHPLVDEITVESIRHFQDRLAK
jgi:hypothetical protein